MARPRGQLDRFVNATVVRPRLAERHRRRTLADGYTGEFEQQIQVALAGVAGNVWGFVDESYSFEYPFLYAPIQRRVDLLTPVFRSGIELVDPNPQYLVIVHAHCVGWTYSEENWIIGSTVRFAVVAPAATTQAIAYNAIAHLAFQGYASLPEGGEFG